jgi:hypothetical protein
VALFTIEGSAATVGHPAATAIAGAAHQSRRVVESQGSGSPAARGNAGTVALALTQGPSVTDVMTVLATVGGSVVVSQTPAGTVQFGFALDGGPAQALGAPVTLDPSGAAMLSLDQGLPSVGPGPSSFVLTAAYTPAPLSPFTAGVSVPLLVGSAGSNAPPCGKRCAAPQAMVVTVPAGSLVISTPYTDSAATTTNAVTITDTRAGDLGWTASAQATDLTGPAGKPTPIPGDTLSFTGVTPRYLEGNALQAGSVSTDDITVFGTAAKSFARKNDGQGPGTVDIYGTLGLIATPTRAGAQAGDYAATVTFTIV